MKLAIIIGHSVEAMGAYSPYLKKHEYELYSEIAPEIWRIAHEAGLEAQIFRRDGISIEKVGEQVNAFCGADGMAVELHFDMFVDPGVGGCSTLYDKDPVENAKFAKIVHSNVMRALTENNPKYSGSRSEFPEILKPKDRGVKLLGIADRGHRNLKAVRCTSCLVEPFFGSSKSDCERFTRNQAAFCRGIIHAATEWLLVKPHV